jgi:multidrug efflux system outer membrane protein
VASSYIELLKLDEQLQIANETVAFRKSWLQLFEKKKKGGQISELELIQVRTEYEYAVARVPSIEMQIAMQENALSVLLGRNPTPIERGKTLDTLGMPGIPQGIPSDVLVRRPDIRRSEQNLIAANARIGVARTLYFPSISLTGLVGYASSDLNDLLQESANIWEYGGEFLGPIFTGGRIKSGIRLAEARYAQLMHEYLSTIQTAFKEVNDALVSKQKFSEELKEQGKLLSTLKDYSDFSRKSYDAGFTSYLTVVDADQKLFAVQIRYAQTQSDLLLSMVNIYKAMGGGWVTEAANQITEPAQNAASKPAKRG